MPFGQRSRRVCRRAAAVLLVLSPAVSAPAHADSLPPLRTRVAVPLLPSHARAPVARCGIVTAAILPVDASGHAFGAYLESGADRPQPVSGVLRISAAGRDYRIAFAQRQTLHKPFNNHERDPIRFDLPDGETPDSAFVESIANADGSSRPCAIEAPWTPGTNSAVDDDVAGLLADAHPTGTPLPLTPVASTETCVQPDLPSSLRFSAPPQPGTWWKREIVVTLDIELDAGSRVAKAVVTDSNAGTDKRYEDAIVTAAQTSVFVTRFVDCRPVPATMMYTQTLRAPF